MKKLYLIRHAKAEQVGGQYRDFFRPLTSSGMMDAARMGRKMANEGIKPDLILSSNAERAIRTAETFADQLDYNMDKTILYDNLYEGRMIEYMAALNQIDEQYNTVLMVAHNPILSFLAEYLTHEDIGSMPTCGVFGVEFETGSWAEVNKGTGKRIYYASPDHY